MYNLISFIYTNLTKVQRTYKLLTHHGFSLSLIIEVPKPVLPGQKLLSRETQTSVLRNTWHTQIKNVKEQVKNAI